LPPLFLLLFVALSYLILLRLPGRQQCTIFCNNCSYSKGKVTTATAVEATAATATAWSIFCINSSYSNGTVKTTRELILFVALSLFDSATSSRETAVHSFSNNFSEDNDILNSDSSEQLLPQQHQQE
jgi:hypothetical protein